MVIGMGLCSNDSAAGVGMPTKPKSPDAWMEFRERCAICDAGTRAVLINEMISPIGFNRPKVVTWRCCEYATFRTLVSFS